MLFVRHVYHDGTTAELTAGVPRFMVTSCLPTSTLASSRIKVTSSCKHKNKCSRDKQGDGKQKGLKDFELHHFYLSVRFVSPADFHFI